MSVTTLSPVEAPPQAHTENAMISASITHKNFFMNLLLY
jgi:hypothetical protein